MIIKIMTITTIITLICSLSAALRATGSWLRLAQPSPSILCHGQQGTNHISRLIAISTPSRNCLPKIPSTVSGVPRSDTSLIFVMRSCACKPGCPGKGSTFCIRMPPRSGSSSRPAPCSLWTRKVSVIMRNVLFSGTVASVENPCRLWGGVAVEPK